MSNETVEESRGSPTPTPPEVFGKMITIRFWRNVVYFGFSKINKKQEISQITITTKPRGSPSGGEAPLTNPKEVPK